MGRDPKRKLEIQPREAKQRNLHHPDDHGEFSHLLISTSWWSSQEEKTTHQKHTTNKRV